MNKASLECRHISLSYGSTPVLRDINLKIEPGEFFALLGPSGSGKSTLLRLIAGFNQHQRGELLVDGQDISGVPPHLRQIGMVFQNYALWPHMTVWDNVAFGLVERRESRDAMRRKVGAVLDLVGLADYARRRPAQLSGGQQQRVALARTIVIEPKLLLLDEPLSNLDKNLRVQMREELKNLQRTLGLTTIFVTHDQEEAMTTADRMAVLDQGILQQVGSAAELYDYPQNRFVAGFVGTANLLDGEVTAVDAAGLNFQAHRLGAHHLNVQIAGPTGRAAGKRGGHPGPAAAPGQHRRAAGRHRRVAPVAGRPGGERGVPGRVLALPRARGRAGPAQRSPAFCRRALVRPRRAGAAGHRSAPAAPADRLSWRRRGRQRGDNRGQPHDPAPQAMAKTKSAHVSETPATALLRAQGVPFTEHPYEYVEHGGAEHSAEVLGFDPFAVVKTLVMQDQDARPLIVLMHGNRKVSTKNLARQIGAKSVEPCKPEVANRHSGYLVGGTSPFATRRAMPVYIESSILELPRIGINGGRRGYLVAIDPQVCVRLLGAKPVQCAIDL